MSIATKVSRATSGGGMTGRVPYGDPGLFSAIGGAIKGAVGGFVSSGFNPIGAVTGAARGIVGGGPKPNPVPSNLPALPQPGIGGAIARVVPGGSSGYVSQAPPSSGGYHLNKTDYFLRDGTFVPKGSRWVKNRRRNSLNPRALSRAMSRVSGAKKASKMLSRVSIRSACKSR